jgi:hypothetical protein
MPHRLASPTAIMRTRQRHLLRLICERTKSRHAPWSVPRGQHATPRLGGDSDSRLAMTVADCSPALWRASHHLIFQVWLAPPHLFEIVQQEIQNILLVLSRFAGAMRRYQYGVKTP